MAKAPTLAYVAYAFQLIPLAAAFHRRRYVTRPQFWVFVWLVLWSLMNAISYVFGALHYNNHFLSYIFTPLQGAAILWALSLYQAQPVARLAIRIWIPIFLAAWALAMLFIENTSSFSTFAEPVYSMLALCTALYTLVRRSGEATEPLMQQDWFWICIGLALYFSALALLLPLSAALVYSKPDIVTNAYLVDFVVNMVACVCLANGFLCSVETTRSGSFFSLPAAR